MAEEVDEIVGEFIVESRESLDELDRELVTLEQHPDQDVLARIFRATHTIKGTSGFLGFQQLEAVTHVGENLLSKLRDGLLTIDREKTTALLRMVDTVREIIDSIEANGAEDGTTHDELIAELSRLEAGEAAVDGGPGTDESVADETTGAPLAGTADETPDVPPAGTADETPDVPAAGTADETTDVPAAGTADETTDVPLSGTADETPDVPPAEPAATSAAVVAERAARAAEAVETVETVEVVEPVERTAAQESIRVDVELLDDLMNLVGELVLARNQILQYTVNQDDSTFSATSQRLNLITTELQEGVMRTRMQPIENVWNKFPRVVRDLTVACDKQATLAMEGKHTELDKTLLEAIKDPLTHLVRNAVDHGLEPPAEREAAGKPAEGTIRLSAYHEGGQVIIEIADDGGGIDPEAIRRKSVQKGLLTHDEAANRTDRDIVNMIFQPGFSTAEAVTNISGRGVGMDVVRTNIESIGGSVDVQSRVGEGTTFKVKIPLTLAIIPALVVTCEGDRYAIPQVSLLELVRIDGTDPQTAIESVHGVPVYRLRGRLLPIVFLSEVFDKSPNLDGESINIVVVRADDREFGLVVDEISDTAEIVVKPLGRILKQLSAFAGATIMGDGHVALILDVLGIAEHIGMASSRELRHAAAEDEAAAAHPDARRLLMLRIGDRRLALPLDTVARLEEFQPEQIEDAGDGRVVQYRGEILNLVFLADELGVASEWGDQPLQVVVYSEDGRSVGVVVDDIFDIVEQAIEVQSGTRAHGTLGSAVIQGQVTDVLDVAGLLRSAVPGLFSVTEEAA